MTLTATDSNGASSATSFTLTATSAATLKITRLGSNHEMRLVPLTDGSVTLTGAFTDGVEGRHLVTVDWGDGSAVRRIRVNQVADTFRGQHHYAQGDIYTITLTLTNEAGESVQKTTQAVVQGVGLVNGTLYVVGSNRSDDLRIERVRSGREEFYRVEVPPGRGPVRTDGGLHLPGQRCQQHRDRGGHQRPCPAWPGGVGRHQVRPAARALRRTGERARKTSRMPCDSWSTCCDPATAFEATPRSRLSLGPSWTPKEPPAPAGGSCLCSLSVVREARRLVPRPRAAIRRR